VRFEVLTAVNIKTIISWDVTPYSLVNSHKNAGETHCPQLELNLKVSTVYFPENSKFGDAMCF